MKTTQASVILLTLAVPALAKKHKSQPTAQGGNAVTNTYEFKNDKFGANDVLNLQATSQVWHIKLL